MDRCRFNDVNVGCSHIRGMNRLRLKWGQCVHPKNTRHSPNEGTVVAHRLRRWPSIVPTLGECLVLAGQAGSPY